MFQLYGFFYGSKFKIKTKNEPKVILEIIMKKGYILSELFVEKMQNIIDDKILKQHYYAPNRKEILSIFNTKCN